MANTKKTDVSNHASAGAVYGLGLIGALIYYIQQADGFWEGILGILQAIVWPAFLVYKLLQLVYLTSVIGG